MLCKLDQANHVNTYTSTKISGKINEQMFFNVLELNGIKLQDSVKDQLFKKFGSGTIINEKRQFDSMLKENDKKPKNQIKYKEALSAIYINMDSNTPLKE